MAHMWTENFPYFEKVWCFSGEMGNVGEREEIWNHEQKMEAYAFWVYIFKVYKCLFYGILLNDYKTT